MGTYLKVGEERKKEPSGNDLFAFYMTLLKHVSALWKMDFSKVFFEVDKNDQCHRDVPTPHAVIVGQDFSSVNIYVDFTLILKNLTLIESVPALIALHYSTDVHYCPDSHLLLELLQKQICVLSPKSGSHKPGKENHAVQSAEIVAYQQFIGTYLYAALLKNKQ
jgi:hypothetical protein